MTEKIILKIEKHEDHGYGWEDSDIGKCVLNTGLEMGEEVAETYGQITKRLKQLAKDGFIKSRDIKKYRYSINRLDGDHGSKIDFNRIVKLAKVLGFQVNLHEFDDFGHLEDIVE